jgi:hypothetical protein
MAHMPNVLDILRNESPTYFHQIAEMPTMGILATYEEMVGEGEHWMFPP